MALIVLHNNDSQGSRAPAAFAAADAVLRITFVHDRIDAASMLAIRALSAQFPGPNRVIWLGHGDNGVAHRGHPLTEARVRIDSGDLVTAFRLLNPNRIYVFSCMGMQWVQREVNRFYNEMTFLNPLINIYAVAAHILGAALPGVAAALLAGQENAPGPFGVDLFQTQGVYGETFIEWRHRVAPQRTHMNAFEAPF